MTELEKAHARIAELEAELAAIGAGGVSGPLMGQPQAMPDLSQLTERGAKAWAGVDAQGLREGRWYMVNKDGMATLCADQADAEQGAKEAQTLWPHMEPHRVVQLVEAGSASLSANAGGEPVAEVVPCHTPSGKRVALRSEAQGLPIGTKLYTHPSPPEGMAGWMTLPGPLPEPGTPVLLDIGKKYPIRAQWVPKGYLESTGDGDFGEYNEASDTYYWPECWYEWNQHEETHWAVSETPRAWQPLPPSPTMDGESNG